MSSMKKIVANKTKKKWGVRNKKRCKEEMNTTPYWVFCDEGNVTWDDW